MASSTMSPQNYTNSQLFIQSQLRTKPKPPPASTSFAGHTAVITGSSSGIGLEAARVMLNFQLSRLILAVRSVTHGEDVAAPLRKANPAAQIEVWPLDMLSYESVQTFAKRCADLPRLDIVILNAAVFNAKFLLSTASHEQMIQVNYLSTALLALLLLPTLRDKSPTGIPGRLTLVSSSSALTSQFPGSEAGPLIPSFDKEKDWSLSAATERYQVSKLLLLALVQKLGDFVSPEKTIINAVDPGLTSGSKLHRNLPAAMRAVLGLTKVTSGRSQEQAAWTYIDAVTVKGKESHGSFIVDWNIHPFHPTMYTEQGLRIAQKLWEETLQESDKQGWENSDLMNPSQKGFEVIVYYSTKWQVNYSDSTV